MQIRLGPADDPGVKASCTKRKEKCQLRAHQGLFTNQQPVFYTYTIALYVSVYFY